MKPKVQVFIDEINKYAENNKLFWVCAVAKDCSTILINHLNELHESARIAVEYYNSIS